MSRASWFSALRRRNDKVKIENSPEEEAESSTTSSSSLTASLSASENNINIEAAAVLITSPAKPKYFSSGQYEYEVSPTSKSNMMCCSSPSEGNINSREENGNSVSNANHALNINGMSTIITERMVPITKTVFLIRHAQSDENRRLASLTKSLKGITKLRLPLKSDIKASVELLNIPAQIDSDVSPEGKTQINALGLQISKDDFVSKMGIQLVAHSPLKRARQTSLGMLQCVTPSIKDHVTEQQDYSYLGKQHPSVDRVVELPVLSERTPLEWLPVNHDAFTKRISEFETWLGEQPEDVIAVVGHSQYFKSMLGLPKKFKNVDVWSLQFDGAVRKSFEDVKEEINRVEREERDRKIKKKIDHVLNGAKAKAEGVGVGVGVVGQGTDKTDAVLDDRDGDGDGDNLQDEKVGGENNNNSGADEDEHGHTNSDEGDVNVMNGVIDNDNGDANDAKADCDPIQTNTDATNKDASILKEKESSDVFETANEIYEIDGVRVDDLELPRGWRDLKRHYTYDPSMPSE